MKANELRIGNWVQSDTNRAYKIELTWFECCKDSRDGRDIQFNTYPIPLTEEWLVKFGFKKKTKTFVMNNISIKQQTKGYFFYLSKMIEDVHSLQNLYFALTGEEFEIKKG